MFSASVEYRYQFGFNPGTGVGFQQAPRAPAGMTAANCAPPVGTPGCVAITPGNSLAALFIRNDGGETVLARWGSVPVAAGMGGLIVLPPGGAVVVEPGEPGLTTGALSYAGGPLTLAWGTLIATTGAPTR